MYWSSLSCRLVLLLAFIAFHFTEAKLISNVFNAVSITSQSSSYPQSLWTARVSFSVTYAQNAEKGDQFELNMPYVLKLYPAQTIGGTGWIPIKDSSGSTIANCAIKNGFQTGSDSKLTCTFSKDGVSSASGYISFQFVFDDGGTPEDLAAANNWNLGINTVTWNDLQATVSLSKDTRVTASVSANNFAGYDTQSPARDNLQMRYFVGSSCPSNSFSEKLSLIYSGRPGNNGDLASCDSVTVKMANSFNAWNKPKNAIDLPDGSYSMSCGSNTVAVTASGIPAGYHIFVDAYQILDRSTTANILFTDAYRETVTCGRSTKTNSDTRTISFYAGTASGYGSQSSQSYATTTQGWSNTYTSTKTSTAVITGTDGVLSPQPIIVIETPTKQTSSTQYTQWTGS